ncbi:metallophosphoesterase [Pseudanabaena sp. FACHB-2040]|uniref:metallophosphoesterase family protein n=1 Tax=Pseudanabaena sp. FACHB-2040 TaxID=2692859 RepID=UPI0016848714|nr:metallophosphoesterase [Pseudanabaena sp. FACHB-2040]MBD2257847.1 metallophosphoesterase [Pseudanabaena sp. FACHB-2040]
MRFWRSLLRIFLGILVGFFLVVALQACLSEQTPPVTSSPTVDTSQAAVPVPKEMPLPPATEAIVASAEPNGLYNPPRGDVRLVVISDLNSAYGSTDYDPEVDKAMTLLPFWQPDLVVCSGDMVAGQNPTLSEDQLKAMWAAFDEHVTAPLRQAKLPFGFTVGNHDASSAQSASGSFLFERERQVATDYWIDPGHDPGVEFVDRYEFPFYYTFKLDDLFFLAWDGSSHLLPQDKLDWVEQALESPAAQSAKLKILLGHLPLYGIAVGRDKPGEVLANADSLQEMLERHQVHTYISGHQHAYYPAHKGQLQLLHTGILGSGPRPFIDSQLPPQKALTVMDISFASPDLTTYTTYDMQTLQLIELEQLPRQITGHNGRVLRRDVDAEDLTASELSACESRLSADLCRA